MLKIKIISLLFLIPFVIFGQQQGFKENEVDGVGWVNPDTVNHWKFVICDSVVKEKKNRATMIGHVYDNNRTSILFSYNWKGKNKPKLLYTFFAYSPLFKRKNIYYKTILPHISGFKNFSL